MKIKVHYFHTKQNVLFLISFHFLYVELCLILNIKYNDTDKSFILPVLEKLSQIYQNYTSVQINQKLNKTKSYLEKQIEEYDLKSQNSIIELQNYSIDNNLVFSRKTFTGNSEIKKNISENPNNFDNYLFLVSPAESLRLDIN